VLWRSLVKARRSCTLISMIPASHALRTMPCSSGPRKKSGKIVMISKFKCSCQLPVASCQLPVKTNNEDLRPALRNSVAGCQFPDNSPLPASCILLPASCFPSRFLFLFRTQGCVQFQHAGGELHLDPLAFDMDPRDEFLRKGNQYFFRTFKNLEQRSLTG